MLAPRFSPPEASTSLLAPVPFARRGASEPAAGRTLVEERTAEGVYLCSDLAPLYARAPWPMLPAGGPAGTVERFVRASVEDAQLGVVAVFDQIAAHAEASGFHAGAQALPAGAFVAGYFAPTSPAALGLEVRVLTPAVPERPASASASGLLDVPHLTVMRYVDAAAPDLRTQLTRSRGGAPMVGARVQLGSSAPRFLLFNARPDAERVPVGSTEVPAEPGASWVLCGLKPGVAYHARLDGRSLLVSERAGGAYTASSAGVLRVPPLNAAAPTTTFTYTLAEPSPVRVAILDAAGREVALLTDGVHAPGTYVLPLFGVAPGQYVVQVLGPGGAQRQEITVPG